MALRCSFAALLTILSASTAPAATSIFYSGEVNLVLGGLPTTPAIGVDLDGAGQSDIAVESKLIPGQTGAATYFTGVTDDPIFVGSGGVITPLNPGYVVTANSSGLTFNEEIFTGFDFTEEPNGVGVPLGLYFSETVPQDYYWGFSFSGNTIGIMPGWMRVTINPIVVDHDNTTLSGGEIILREWAYDTARGSIRVGQIPEPSTIVQATLAIGAFAAARGSRGGRRR